MTGGFTTEELEKRISSELIEGNPVLFLDNLNNMAFRSNLLASAITERPARVRLLGRSQMVPLNPSAFIVLTGNGLTVSEDLARRFITVELDPRTEDPEARRFPNDIQQDVIQHRAQLLAAALTIWRWGRLNHVREGRPLGSFSRWCRWVRDPLLELGCCDPVERISETKERDGRRQTTTEVFTTWWQRHGDEAVAVREIHSDVLQLLDSHNRGRQYVSAQLEKLTGTRIAGLMLTRQAAAGKWGAATYSMKNLGGPEMHRDHRGHRGGQTDQQAPEITPRTHDQPYSGNKPKPMPPMPPMTSGRAVEIDHVDEDEFRAEFDERAAVLEYEAGLPRPEAEAQAAAELGLSTDDVNAAA